MANTVEHIARAEDFINSFSISASRVMNLENLYCNSPI